MSNVIYAAQIRIERVNGPLRIAYLPPEERAVAFGVHGAIAAHYGVTAEVSSPQATTIDYLIAAAGG